MAFDAFNIDDLNHAVSSEELRNEGVDESHNVLVDIQSFPGNSGSPIVTRPEIVSI